jgi:hypothetical protein
LPVGSITVQVGFKPEPKLQLDPYEKFSARFRGEDPDKPLPLMRTEQRVLSAEQRERIRTMLAELVNDLPPYRVPEFVSPIEILCVPDNTEALAFATQLAEVLGDIGWDVVGGKVVVDSDIPRRLEGVRVYTAARNKFFAHGTLSGMLARVGVEVNREVLDFESFLDEGPLKVMVGW